MLGQQFHSKTLCNLQMRITGKILQWRNCEHWFADYFVSPRAIFSHHIVIPVICSHSSLLQPEKHVKENIHWLSVPTTVLEQSAIYRQCIFTGLTHSHRI